MPNSRLAGLAAMFLATLAPPPNAFAQAEEVIFEGRLVITKSQYCTEGRTSRGARFVSVYHIANLGGNRNDTTITSVGGTSAAGYQLPGDTFTDEFKEVEGHEIGSGAQGFDAAVRITKSRPAQPDENTDAVFLTGQIRNAFDDSFFEGPECLVTFRASYIRRR